MRILFTFAGGSGHFEPLVPLARLAQAAEHQVAFACQPALIPVVEGAGFTAFATGGATFSSTPQRTPLLKLDMEREEAALRDGYADRIARERAALLLPLCAQWQPDLLVSEETDFGSPIVAERLGLAYASLLVLAAGSMLRPGLVAGPLNRLRAEHGLPPDPGLAMLSRYLVLSPFPPGFRHPDFPLPATAHSFRPSAIVTGRADRDPPWPAFESGAPLVYFTLGTVFNLESGDLFERVLSGLRGLPINVIATVGREIDPGEFGPQPPNIRIEQYLPQASVLPQCALVVSHGGSGSVMGALAHGLPSVLIPMGADQPFNADRCAALGAALALDAVEAAPETIGEAVMAALEDPAYRRAAGVLRAEIAALPGPETALALLERLVSAKKTLLL
jgi:UDP:flavonoid glycosyltransferase YjiC (YdhE family)